MAKVTVRNHAEHEFHLPGTSSAEAPGAAAVGQIKFPRAGIRVGADGVSIDTPGEIEVDSSVIERMKKHPVTASWLNRDPRGRLQLEVVSSPETPPAGAAKK